MISNQLQWPALTPKKGLVQVTAPSEEPIDQDDLDGWLRTDADEGLLTELKAFIKVARAHAENFTARAFVTQTWELSADNWPLDKYGQIVLPLPPLQTVDSIKYYDSSDSLQTFDPSNYYVDTKSFLGRIALKSGNVWPNALCRPNSVTVRFTAGYGGKDSVPEGIKLALKYIAGHWFDNRSLFLSGQLSEIPHTFHDLISSFCWEQV